MKVPSYDFKNYTLLTLNIGLQDNVLRALVTSRGCFKQHSKPIHCLQSSSFLSGKSPSHPLHLSQNAINQKCSFYFRLCLPPRSEAKFSHKAAQLVESKQLILDSREKLEKGAEQAYWTNFVAGAHRRKVRNFLPLMLDSYLSLEFTEDGWKSLPHIHKTGRYSTFQVSPCIWWNVNLSVPPAF